MFEFLKKKLKDAIGSFSKKAEKEAEVVEEPEERIVEKREHKAEEKKNAGKKPETKKEVLKEVKKESLKEEIKKETKKEGKEQKKEIKEERKEPAKEEVKKDTKKEEKEQKPVQKEKPHLHEEKKQHEKVHERIIEEPAKEKEEEKEESEKAAHAIKHETHEEKHEEKKGFFGKLFGKKEEKKETKEIEEPAKEHVAEHVKETIKEADEEEHKARGFFGKLSDSITHVSLSESKFDELFWELELGLLENNVAVEVIEKIKKDLREELVDKKLPRNALDKKVIEALKHSIEGLFDVEKIDLIKEAKKKKPYVIVIIGVNGSGKTTTIAKLVNLFKKNNLEPVVAACDTFRAAAIQQIEEHTTKLGVRLIKHDYGADPAAVAFDAIEHAKAKGKDIVLIDTAGRLHSNSNLMAELEKVIRISKPDLKIFIGESIAGNDVVEQVKLFNEKVGIDGLILSKADIDEKGGAAISVSYITGKPILYLGMGQNYDDLVEFDKKKILEQIGF